MGLAVVASQTGHVMGVYTSCNLVSDYVAAQSLASTVGFKWAPKDHVLHILLVLHAFDFVLQLVD